MSESTTIRIKKTTKDKLDAIGCKGQSYDDIIREQLEVNRQIHELYYEIIPNAPIEDCEELHRQLKVLVKRSRELQI